MIIRSLTLILITLFVAYELVAQDEFRFNHILITNDDGIEEADRLLALASSVKRVAKRVSVVVSSFDRSGTSNDTAIGKYQSAIQIECEYFDSVENIGVYTTAGNPADCVLIGLNGLFADDKPDIVLSGINGGSNIGPEWFGSGTVGAARMAAFLGAKGIAFSGFDENEESMEAIPNWISRFIESDIIDRINDQTYLTIAFPDVLPKQIKGIKIAERRIAFDNPENVVLNKVHGDDPYEPGTKSIWVLSLGDNLNDNTSYDDTFLEEGYIIITPMTINENDQSSITEFEKSKHLIPSIN